MSQRYSENAPARSDIDATTGPLLLEFGSNTCGICRGTEPLITAALADHASLAHIKVQDGSGRPLGRSFRVKLWPTLIFLRDGNEVARLVRPDSVEEIRNALTQAFGVRS